MRAVDTGQEAESGHVILIAGPAGAGKDTLAHWICTDFAGVRCGLMDPLDAWVQDLLGAGKHRTVKQQVGQAMRGADESVWIRALQQRVASPGLWVVADVRFLRELRAFPAALTLGVTATPTVRAARLAARDGAEVQDLTHATEQEADAAVAGCHIQYHNDAGWSSYRVWYETLVAPRVRDWLLNGWVLLDGRVVPVCVADGSPRAGLVGGARRPRPAAGDGVTGHSVPGTEGGEADA